MDDERVMSKTDIIYRQESYTLVGACFEVYKEMGAGFLEAVYQECLCLELKRRGIPFTEKPFLQLEYKRELLEQNYQPDFLCYDRIIVELKAMKDLADEHRAQVINYLKATKKHLGLLINFGHYPQLQYERYLNQ